MADEILADYGHYVSALTLIPSGGGAFEVMVDDELIYSKKQTKRHADEGEVQQLFKEVAGIKE